MDITRESARVLLVNGETFNGKSKADIDRLLKALGVSGAPKPPSADVQNYGPDIEAAALHMTRDFHSWMSGGDYVLEPGFRHLIGQESPVIFIHYRNLREGWDDECRRAFGMWEPLGFKFRETTAPALADIIVDDSIQGTYATRRVARTGREQEGLPVVQSVARELHIWREYPEWDRYRALLHEIGHLLGLGHPGNYHGTRPDAPALPADDSVNTVMSYFGGSDTAPGDADRLALQMIYG